MNASSWKRTMKDVTVSSRPARRSVSVSVSIIREPGRSLAHYTRDVPLLSERGIRSTDQRVDEGVHGARIGVYFAERLVDLFMRQRFFEYRGACAERFRLVDEPRRLIARIESEGRADGEDRRRSGRQLMERRSG